MTHALAHEIRLRRDFFPPETPISTLYFGGGTPSMLAPEELETILSALRSAFDLSRLTEVTLEANPDDISWEQLTFWKASGINRLSIGIQSFRDADLKRLNRAHSGTEAVESVLMAQEAGFSNLTLDLIYGIPGLDPEAWRGNLLKAVSLNVPHISAYALTVEEKTRLSHEVKSGRTVLPADEIFESHFSILAESLSLYGFEQYEISNFARPGFRAIHNSSYWRGEPYLGIGPSAHSFTGHSRMWNVSSNPEYIRMIGEGRSAEAGSETLSAVQQRNEYRMTRLRLVEGLDAADWKTRFGSDFDALHQDVIRHHLKQGNLIRKEGAIVLTEAGKLISDAIIRELFEEDETE